MLAGVSLYLSRPFVVGESVVLQTGPTASIAGVVTNVSPLRTVLRTEDEATVALPNKTVIGERLCQD